MQYNQSFITPDEAATVALAAALASQCGAGDCILLSGELGTGKTAFARGFIRALSQPSQEVVSPTFNLLQTYPTHDGAQVWHFDLYRLESPQEIEEIGLDEALQSGITLVEWPAIAHTFWPKEALDVTISIGDDPGSRHFTFAGLASIWKDRLHKIKGINP